MQGILFANPVPATLSARNIWLLARLSLLTCTYLVLLYDHLWQFSTTNMGVSLAEARTRMPSKRVQNSMVLFDCQRVRPVCVSHRTAPRLKGCSWTFATGLYNEVFCPIIAMCAFVFRPFTVEGA